MDFIFYFHPKHIHRGQVILFFEPPFGWPFPCVLFIASIIKL